MSARQLIRQSLRSTLRAVGLEEKSLGAYRRFQAQQKRKVRDVLIRNPPYDEAIKLEICRARDPVRYSAIALALRTMDRESVKGSIAEVGVFKGVTSRFIRIVSRERQFYLFDTFEGFPDEQLEVTSDTRFRDTSVESVLAMVGDTSRVEIRKGVFPDTAKGLEQETFAFVSLDADLYTPTLAGLEFFYPCLSPGGFMFLHDYTSTESNHGVSRATDEFLADKRERVTALPDRFGTAVFRKAL